VQWDGVFNGKDFGIIGNVYDGGCASDGVWASVLSMVSIPVRYISIFQHVSADAEAAVILRC
jgi:hypothetical protein